MRLSQSGTLKPCNSLSKGRDLSKQDGMASLPLQALKHSHTLALTQWQSSCHKHERVTSLCS